ncbi:hypothetical protein ACP70R_002880 [Stipagrostis hirtigluma subsp. patula]
MEAAAAAAATVAKKRKPDGEDGHGDGDEGLDLISRLPDEVLGTIISFLPTKDGARTQAVSRRWRPLWRAAPLNLGVDYDLSGQERKRIAVASKILSRHPGPARRFAFPHIRLRDRFAKIDGWLRSRALTGLREIEFSYDVEMQPVYPPLPPSALRFAPTLCVAKIAFCSFPSEVEPSLNFPCLKQLTLCSVTILEDTLHSVLSGCPVLESLWLGGIIGTPRLRISSPTLRSFGFNATCYCSKQDDIRVQELVIEDAPCLERLPLFYPYDGPATIRVIRAPKLEILGALSAGIRKLELETTVFLDMVASRLTTMMRTVKVLALESAGPNLDSVIDFLKCFPCLEKLYITSHLQMDRKNPWSYSAQDPIECLELHLKKVVIKEYCGMRPDVAFAKYFVLNAKVLKTMQFSGRNNCSDKWVANQHRRLQLDNRASRSSRFVFGNGCDCVPLEAFSKTDPFEWRNPRMFGMATR